MSKIERMDHFAAEPEPLPTLPKQGEAGATPVARKTVTLRSERSEPLQPDPSPASEHSEHSGDKASPSQETPPKRRSWTRWALFALLPVALLAGGYWYVTGGQVMSTDDAYVQADKVGISTDVSGIVQDVAVAENQQVS